MKYRGAGGGVFGGDTHYAGHSCRVHWHLFHAAANTAAITAQAKSMCQQWLAHYPAAYCVLPPRCTDFYYPGLFFILSLSHSLAVNSVGTKPWTVLYSWLGGVRLYKKSGKQRKGLLVRVWISVRISQGCCLACWPMCWHTKYSKQYF